MDIPIDGKRAEMVEKLKQNGFIEKTQENETAVELKGTYFNQKAWLRLYNSKKTKTLYLVDIFLQKNTFKNVYQQYIHYREILTGIYGKPSEIVDDDPKEIFDSAYELGLYTFSTSYEVSEGLIMLEISNKNRIEISFQDKINAQIMRNEK